MAPGPDVREGELLWTPTPEQVSRTNLASFTAWLEESAGRSFAGYHDLWRWSVTDLDGFWRAIWDYGGVKASQEPTAVLSRRSMPGAEWFPGSRLNFAQHVLRNERPGEAALLHLSETQALDELRWEDLAGQVRAAARGLEELGVGRGDRVAGYLPNVPEAMVAMLATASVGAVWASCSPDFGARGAVDRLGQVGPKVLIAVDGYRYGGRDFDRSGELARIAKSLEGLEALVLVPRRVGEAPARLAERQLAWAQLLEHPRGKEGFRFAQVPFEQPLWVLFSSGTTGPPKAIVHSHGGILLEHLKLQGLHMDLHPGDRMFFHTTTGWMMWNFLLTSLLVGACPVLYDGNPAYPGPDVLWRMAQDSGAVFFGASPAYVELMVKSGIVPGRSFDLSALRAVMPAGSPVSPGCTAWFYANVKEDLWVCTGSGGTDCCCGFVGGVPTLPVYAGEMQAPSLGVAAAAYDEEGRAVVDQVGELVITEPMPSMPVSFWNDGGGELMRSTYFARYPGVWRQGDFFRINGRGGCFVLGRSDATLNRHGVRIGTAEIYRALESVEEVDDALVVNLDLPGGRSFMPLFVTLRGNRRLDRGVEEAIRDRLRVEYTPRHVPDRIVQVGAIPLTLSGKKLELPVRRILLGTPPDQAASREAMADPSALDDFIEYAATQRDYAT